MVLREQDQVEVTKLEVVFLNVNNVKHGLKNFTRATIKKGSSTHLLKHEKSTPTP